MCWPLDVGPKATEFEFNYLLNFINVIIVKCYILSFVIVFFCKGFCVSFINKRSPKDIMDGSKGHGREFGS